MSVIEAHARNRDCRIKQKGGRITLYFGSRLIYRLVGSSAGRIPYTVQVCAVASPGPVTGLTADAYSDAGPFFLFRLESDTSIYKHFMSETLSELQHL